MDWPAFVPLLLAAGVEWVEAFTIVLAVSLTIGWGAALGAAAAGLGTLTLLTAATGGAFSLGLGRRSDFLIPVVRRFAPTSISVFFRAPPPANPARIPVNASVDWYHSGRWKYWPAARWGIETFWCWPRSFLWEVRRWCRSYPAYFNMTVRPVVRRQAARISSFR
jgi:hypothetical protein